MRMTFFTPRRTRLIKRQSIIVLNTCLLLILFSQEVISQNALLIPDTLSGTNINMTLQLGTHQFLPGDITNTMGANGSILGPTLLLNQGDLVNFSVDNQLGDSTTIHWHGMHVSPENDGGPHTVIVPNDVWSPSFNILDKAGTYWYHPHLHHKTNKHVSKGIAGMIWVRDSEEASLALPRTYGVDDFPLVLQTKDFDANNQIIVHSNSDDAAMVNATIDPFLDVPAQVIRYRILNGSSQRSFNLGLSNGQAFYQIASDGGLLSKPFSTTRLLISPGERIEILIDFNGMNGQNVYLQSFASELPNGIYGATNPGITALMTLDGYNPNPLNGSDYNLLRFNVVAQNASPITGIPNSLAVVTPIPENTANLTREFELSPVIIGLNELNGGYLINDAPFDMSVINETITLDNIEIWKITNKSGIAHPFHIHDIQFYILSRNGMTPPESEQGRKDVILVKPVEIVRVIAKFDDFSSSTVPYMYHCHLLTHEEGGMMGQFLVVDPVSVDDNAFEDKVNIYPNPSKGSINIELEGNLDLGNIEVFDQLGRLVSNMKINSTDNTIQISGLPIGIFLIKLKSDGRIITKKIIIQ